MCQHYPHLVKSLSPPSARPKKQSSDENSYVPGPGDNPLYTAEPLTLDDLKLLSDLFYLPYEYGRTARTMLQELDWLRKNASAATAETDKVCFYRFFFSNADNVVLMYFEY